MIKNQKQYALTQNKIEEFKTALEEAKSLTDIDPILKKAQIEALQSSIEEFQNQLDDYDELSRGSINMLKADSFEDLRKALIKARIIKGWSQGHLAEKVGIKEQQIQRYEACNYSTANMIRIQEVADALGLQIDGIKIQLTNFYLFSPSIDNEKLRFLEERISNNEPLLI